MSEQTRRTMRAPSLKARPFTCALLLSTLLAGCASEQTVTQHSPQLIRPIAKLDLFKGIEQEIPAEKISNIPRQLAAEGIRLLGEGALDAAGERFNQALKMDPTNANLQLLNALTYHINGLQGDVSLLDFAREGYELAIQFDPSNWIAYYQSGLLYMDKREFSAAQKHFAEALLHRPENREILYNMVCASYYNQDPLSASAALTQLERLEPDTPRTLRAAAMIAASLGEEQSARKYHTRYSELDQDRESVDRLMTRLKDWDSFHAQRNASAKPLQNPDHFISVATPTKKEQESSPIKPPATSTNTTSSGAEKPAMVIVDVVIVRSEEKTRNRRGVNLLEGLTLQFGSSETDLEWSRGSIARAISLPALNYTLNIFNSANEHNEVLARPTLVAEDKLESRFFSGINIRAAAVGASTSSSKPLLIQDDIGVELKVKPEIISSQKVKIWVNATRTFLRTPSDDVDFQYRIETSKTNVEANVLMNFGETLIISGLSEKETESIRKGVPGLQDVPVAQYLFSQQNTLNFQKSVLILLTPRKPTYVYQDTSSVPPEQRSEVLNELQARFSDWFKPYPNWASVFHHLQSNTLYREFRTGDVTLERWESQKYLRNRLKLILDFLYF